MIAAASIVDCLYTSLHVLSNTVLMESHDAVAIRWRRRTDLKFLSAVGDLVIKSEMIEEDLKGAVLRILSADPNFKICRRRGKKMEKHFF